ncbi:MAG: polysaccharide biosynthesis/export family protein [Verrucomicrobia bacterium]|nr:polysaccharide biosynthesis/export family protein [Verrucomicrobiota bacterium]
MGYTMNVARLSLRILVLAAVGFFLAGCAGLAPADKAESEAKPDTNQMTTGNALLRPNDLVSIVFSGTGPKNFDARIKEDGTLLPPIIDKDGPVQDAGLTGAQLEAELQKRYAKYFKNLTVTVLTENRWFYVAGEVRVPSRFPYSGELKVTQAIAVAQGLTDFASKHRIQLTRANGEKVTIDYTKALSKPKFDLPVYPGDHIFVPRRIL